MKSLLESIRVPAVNLPEDRPTDRDDFTEHRPVSLDKLGLVSVDQASDEDLPLLLLVCAEHLPIKLDEDHNLDCQQLYWSSPEHQLISRKLTDQLLVRLEMDSLDQTLEIYVKEMFELVQPQLEHWSKNPAARHATCLLFSSIKGEVAGEHLGKVFPYMLRWLDSWMVEPRVQGANLTLQILINTPSTWLTKFGRDKVLYDAVVRMLNAMEDEVLAAVSQPLPLLLELVSRDKRGDPTCINDVDKFVHTILQSIECESNLTKKLIKTRLLDDSWRLIGKGCLRWIKRLSRLIESDLGVVGGHSLILLKIWESVCEKFPVSAAREQRTMLPAFMKLGWEWSHGAVLCPKVNEELLLRVLRKQISTDPTTFLKYTKGIQDVKTNSRFSKLMTSLIQFAEESKVSTNVPS